MKIPIMFKEILSQISYWTVFYTSLKNNTRFYATICSEIPEMAKTYNGRPIETMFYDKTAQTIHINEILYNGSKLKPEKIMRFIHVRYPDFLKFHKHLEETLRIWRVANDIEN